MSAGDMAGDRFDVEWREVGAVRPYPGNPRKNAEAIAPVARSLKEFGFQKPIVVDAAGVIICGHTCFAAALELGLTRVPVHVAHLSEDQARAFRIADNKLGELADWDYELLSLELEKLEDADLADYGFDPAALAALVDHQALPPVSEDASRSKPLENLRWGTQSVPLSQEETARLDALLEQHIAQVGTPFGFAAWLCSHVPT